MQYLAEVGVERPLGADVPGSRLRGFGGIETLLVTDAAQVEELEHVFALRFGSFFFIAVVGVNRFGEAHLENSIRQ